MPVFSICLKALPLASNSTGKVTNWNNKITTSVAIPNNNKLNEEKLFVKTCYVDEGIVMKRAKMDSRGHVGRNDHKTSHITIVVSELNK